MSINTMQYAKMGARRLVLSVLASAAIALAGQSADAQGVRDLYADYDTQMPGSDHGGAPGPIAFGDQTDLYSGSTSFLVTDVSLPGNSDLPVAVQRSLEASDSGLSVLSYGFPDTFLKWTRFEVPNLSGIYASGGWVSANGYNSSQQRCSVTSGPPEIKVGKPGTEDSFSGNDYWHGNYLNLPGTGGQLLLTTPPGSPPPPTDGATYYWTTKDHWQFSCLPTTANGVTGEGFLARSPDGKKYWFNWLVKWRQVSTLRKYSGFGDEMVLPRHEYRLLVTRVEDRFGNWVNYTYSGKDLSSITSSDGRQLTLTYAAPGGSVTSVSDGARTWTYDYSSGTRVNFPDGTAWRSTVSGPGFVRHDLTSPDGSAACEGMVYTGEATLTIEQRSGAVGTFTFRPLRRGLSHVYYNPAAAYPCPQLPKYHDNIALVSKVISGSGLSGITWNYAYGPANACFAGATGYWNSSPCTAGSPTTRYVEVTGPGLFTRYTFGNKWHDTEGTMFRVETGSSSTNILRDENLTWQTFSGGYGPTAAGDGFLAGTVRTLATRVISQGGATYSTTNSNWDPYFKPQTISETGPNGGARTTQLTYYNNRAKWIIGNTATSSYTGKSISYTFDGNGSVSTVVEDGITTAYTYQSDGSIATITKPGSRLYSYSNYKRGIAQNESQPGNVSRTRAVNDAGFVTSETDGEGHTRSFGRDTMGRVTAMDFPIGNDSTIAFSGGTKGTQTATRGALVETTTYDALWRPTSIVRGGIATTFEYDASGRRTFASNPGASVGTRHQYDALNRVTRIDHPDGTYKQFTYGAAQVAVRDERGNVTTYSYRAYGNPEKTVLVGISAPISSANVSIARGSDDLINSVTQGGLTRSFAYDAHKHLVSETNPESGTTIFERDDVGNMVARTIGGVRTDFVYDGRNRLTQTNFTDGTPSITWSYSKTDKLKSASSPAVARALSYDANDNLTAEVLTVAGLAFSENLSYDANDHLTSIAYPKSGRVISYAPDVLGRPTQVSGYASSVTHWPSGAVRDISFVNGMTSSYEQDARLWTSGVRARKGATYYVSSTYAHDGAGNITSIADGVDSTLNRTLGYDDLGRLTSASGPWGAGTINYDPVGNIASQNFGSFQLSYAYSPQNRLASVSGSRTSTFGYDASGSVVAATGATYQYDGAMNLRCVNCSSSNKTEYVYDALGKRASVTKGGVPKYEFYTSTGMLLAEYTPTNSDQLVEYIYLGNNRIAQTVSNSRPITPMSIQSGTILVNTSFGATLTVSVGGASPSGSVSFFENGVLLGSANVTGGLASINLEGVTLGNHEVTAVYSGDGANSSNTVTLQLRFVNLDWLPAVLELLLH
jgi:YD repeat-containing protein